MFASYSLFTMTVDCYFYSIPLFAWGIDETHPSQSISKLRTEFGGREKNVILSTVSRWSLILSIHIHYSICSKDPLHVWFNGNMPSLIVIDTAYEWTLNYSDDNNAQQLTIHSTNVYYCCGCSLFFQIQVQENVCVRFEWHTIRASFSNCGEFCFIISSFHLQDTKPHHIF